MEEDFAQQLGRHRQREGLSLGALAQRADLPKATVQDWLEGQVRRPRDWQRVLRVAAALNLSGEETDELLRQAGHPPHRQLPLERLREARLQPEARALLDRWLDRLASAPSAESAPPAQDPAAAHGPPPARHQLRAPVADFVGRAAEIQAVRATLQAALQSGRLVAAISGVQGMGGVGKTELAYVVAQELRDSFPDAQIVLQLQGAGPASLTPEQALQSVIRAFTPEARLPDSLATLEGLYRAQLHAKRVLILADDARDAAQVRALMPPPGCALLITSRQRFHLPGMVSIALEQLPPELAAALVGSICPRLSADEAAALARACGHLPLALRVAAGILQNDQALAVPAYLARLADDRQRLQLLRDPDDPELDVAATLALSYDMLDRSAQALFRQLGVFAADFSTELARNVVQTAGAGDLEETLRSLLRRNLIHYNPDRARWQLHDQIRALAQQRLEAAGEAAEVQGRYAQAVVRITGQLQEQYLAGGEQTIGALAWFDAERPHIDAARRWAVQHAETSAGSQVLLDVAFSTSYIGQIRYHRRHESIPLWGAVAAAARRAGNRLREAAALGNLGQAHQALSEFTTAIGCYEQILRTFREEGQRRSEATALICLGLAHTEIGDAHKAISSYEQSLAIARAIGNRRLESQGLGGLSMVYRDLGQPHKALDYCEQDLAITRELGDHHGESVGLNNQASILICLGELRRGSDVCARALALKRTLDDQQGEGYILGSLARIHALQGDSAQALSTLAQALALLQGSDDRRGIAECQLDIGLALAQRGQVEQGLPLLQAAVAYQKEIGHARAAEHSALLARLEAGEPLPQELHIPLR